MDVFIKFKYKKRCLGLSIVNQNVRFGQVGLLGGICCIVLARISHEEHQKEGYNKTISIDSTEIQLMFKITDCNVAD